MKTMFYMIIAAVFIAVRLIAPGSFDSDDPTGISQEIVHDIRPETIDTIQREMGPAVINETVPEPVIPETGPAAVEEQDQTSPVSDLQTMLETPKVTDNFDQGSAGFGINAGLNDDDTIRIIALNNKLSLEPKKNNGWLSWRLRPPVFKDGAAEMEFV